MLIRDFAKSICLKRSRIERQPHYVFLCGGAMMSDDLVQSARQAFISQRNRSNSSDLWERIVLAEEIFNKFPEAEYQDLLSFEQDLAQLSSLIVIFLESTGSFAELGSFVAMPNVRRKVAVVVAEKYADNKSFVWMGPITYLKKNESDIEHQVYTYSWNPDGDPAPPETFFEDAESLAEQLEECLKAVRTNSILDIQNDLHIMLLMAEFLNVVRISSVLEVAEFLVGLGVDKKECYSDQIKRRLALLVCLDLIEKKQYGHNQFYIGVVKNKWINFGYAPSSTVRDGRRWASLFAENRLLSENKQKMLALKSWMKINEKEDELESC